MRAPEVDDGRQRPGPGRRILDVQAPIVPVVADWIRASPGTISLGQGVVFYGPPASAGRAIEGYFDVAPNHGYGPVQGDPRLLERIAAKLRDENGIDCGNGDSRIVVTAGANMGFLNALLAITDPGDEVILPVPCYFNHEMAIRIAGARPILVPTSADFHLDPMRIEDAITARTRAIVTVSPCNPTGAVQPAGHLAAVNDIAARHGLFHISDEAYEYFVYEGRVHSSPGRLADAGQHTISLYSLSKAYGFAGWRVGYMVLPDRLFASVMKIQDTNVICAAGITQRAALGALEAGPAHCRQHLPTLDAARRQLLEALARLPRLLVPPRAEGAFYVLAQFDAQAPAMEVVQRLIREHHVAVMPGEAFGVPHTCALRISYGALDPARVDEAIGRLTRGLRALMSAV